MHNYWFFIIDHESSHDENVGPDMNNDTQNRKQQMSDDNVDLISKSIP